MCDNRENEGIVFDGDPNTISAYAAFEKGKKKKSNKKCVEVEPRKSNNPLTLFLDAAKSLGCYGGCKVAECFR